MVLPWVTQGGPTPLRGLAECRAKGVCPRKEVPASLLHERGNHQVVDGKFCQGLCNPKRNFKYFSPASADVKLGPKGLTFWINRGKMNVAKRLLNHKGEGRGIWWFCFLHDIINSYLPSAGQRLMNCQSHVACSLCRMHRAGKNWWCCAVLVCVHSPVPQTSPTTSSTWEGGREFSLPFDVGSASVLVTLSPWGNWGTRQLNAACKKSVMDSGCHRPELQNCSSFLRLCSIVQRISRWAGWQTCWRASTGGGCDMKHFVWSGKSPKCVQLQSRQISQHRPRTDKCVGACIIKS